jgi:cell division protein FtsQ
VSPVAVSADRRFHRAHVKPARRRSIWRTVAVGIVKYAVVLGVGFLVASRGATFMSTSPLLQIDRIESSGNHRLSSAAIRTILADLPGENILFADLDLWRAKLMENAWVREASFKRSLPSSIEVVVQERAPIAVGRMEGRLYLVDERGVRIDEYGPQYGNLDLPIVDGFGSDGKNPKIDDARGALAARLIMALRQKPEIATRLSQVDVSDVHNASILLNDDPAELRVGDDRFLERVESYLSLSDALHQRVPEIDYVDLRFDGRVYVRPLGKAGRTAASAGHPMVSRVTEADRH